MNQISHQSRQSIILALGPAVFDRHTASLDVASFLQATAERSQDIRIRPRQCAAEKPDYRYRRLLRARCEWPRSRAAEQRDERAALHSITSSARSNIDVGILMPIVLAVWRFTTSSNLVGCSIGKSAALAPRRILST